MVSSVSSYNTSENLEPNGLQLNHLALIEHDLKFCNQGAVTEELVHLLHLQLSGCASMAFTMLLVQIGKVCMGKFT